MRKIFVSLFMFVAVCSMAQQPRTPEEIKKMIDKNPAVEILQPGLNETSVKMQNSIIGKEFTSMLKNNTFKEISLKSINEKNLNTIEKNLLTQFENITLFGNMPCYFAHSENGQIAIYDLNGQEILPQVQEHVVATPGYNDLWIGPYTFERFYNFVDSLDVAKQEFMGITLTKHLYNLGTYHAIIEKNTAKHIIPYNKYDGIRVVLNDYELQKELFKNVFSKKHISSVSLNQDEFINYLVFINDINGNRLWGVHDHTGKEILPAIYKGIIFEKGKYTGTNDMTMAECDSIAIAEAIEAAVKLEEQEAKRAERREKAQKWASVLQGLGELLINTGEMLNTMQIGNNNTSYSNVSSNTTTSTSSKSNNGKQSEDKDLHYMIGLYQTDSRAYDGWENQLRDMKLNPERYSDLSREQYCNKVREIQKTMKNLRERITKKGGTKSRSSFEDWNP